MAGSDFTSLTRASTGANWAEERVIGTVTSPRSCAAAAHHRSQSTCRSGDTSRSEGQDDG